MGGLGEAGLGPPDPVAGVARTCCMRCWLRAMFAVLLVGCRCGEAPRSAPPVPAKFPASAATLARRVCDVLQRQPAQRRAQCCGAEPRHFALECEQALGGALARQALEIDEAALEECAAASAREQSGCDWVTPGQPLPPAQCRALARGRVQAGDSCRSALECAASLHCAGSTPSEAGHCAAPEPAGSACEASADALATWLFAATERQHPACAGGCSLLTHQCQDEPRAAPHATGLARAQPGEACRSDLECESGGCEAGRCGRKCALTLQPASPLSLSFPGRPTARAQTSPTRLR